MNSPQLSQTERDPDQFLAKRPLWLRLTILLGALALLFVGESQIFRGLPGQVSISGWVLISFGLVLTLALIGSNVLKSAPDLEAAAGAGTGTPVRIRPGWLVASLVLTGWLMWRSVQRPTEAYLGEYVLVWALAILTLAMAVWSGRADRGTDFRPFLRWEYGVLLLLVLGSLAVRGIDLGHFPALMDQDEAAFAREGAALAYSFHLQTTPFAQGIYSYAQAYQLLIGLSTLIFGKTLFAARLPAMLLGAFGVPAVYLLGRELFNRAAALVAALFMLGWAYQVLFSRLALNQSGDPVFTTLAFYFLLRGLRRQQISDFFWAGVLLAIAQLFYLGARIAPLVMIAYLLILLIRQPRQLIGQWRLLAVMLLVGLIVALPQHFWIYYFQQPFTTRLNEKSIFNAVYNARSSALAQAAQDGTLLSFIGSQVSLSFGGLFTTSDTGGWYGVGSNLLGVIGAPLLLIGTLATLRVGWSRSRWLLPLLWSVAVISSGSILSLHPPAYERYFPAVSAFALLVAAGSWAIAFGAARLCKQPRMANPLLVLLGVLILSGNLAFLLFDYIPASAYFNNLNNWRTNRVADEVQRADQAGRYVVLVGGFGQEVQKTTVVQYYLAGTPYLYIADSLSESITNGNPNLQIDYSKPLTFLVSAQRYADLLQIEDDFPNGMLTAAYLPQDHTLAFFVYNANVNQTHF